jgi:hypothetical protein
VVLDARTAADAPLSMWDIKLAAQESGASADAEVFVPGGRRMGRGRGLWWQERETVREKPLPARRALTWCPAAICG